AAGVVTGIGFIGGGAIMHDGHGVHGLNTAATLWTTASMGLAAGGGYYAVTGMIFVAVLMVQFPLELVEQWIDRASRRKEADAGHEDATGEPSAAASGRRLPVRTP